MVRKAQCCCGQIYVVVRGEPSLHGLCHCANCKARTGSAFGMNAYFPNSQILETAGTVGIYRIRDEQERFFCQSCGTTVYWRSRWQPDATGIAAGCFTDEPLPAPALTVSNEHQCEWLTLPDDWATSLTP